MGEDEVTVTSGLHAKAERTKKPSNKTEQSNPHPVKAQTKVRKAQPMLESPRNVGPRPGVMMMMFITITARD